MGNYTNKIFICPFYTSNAKGLVRCEGGNISFCNEALSKEYFDCFCASYNWKGCSIARALVGFYEKSDSIPKGKRRKKINLGGEKRC